MTRLAYSELYPVMERLRKAGATYRAIAEHLNQTGRHRKHAGPWVGKAVSNVMRRYRSLTEGARS